MRERRQIEIEVGELDHVERVRTIQHTIRSFEVLKTCESLDTLNSRTEHTRNVFQFDLFLFHLNFQRLRINDFKLPPVTIKPSNETKQQN